MRDGRPQSMGAIRDWIQTKGKTEGAIPKHSTKTIKMRAPVTAAEGIEESSNLAEEHTRGGKWGWMVYVIGIALVLICFIVGKKISG